MIVAQISDSHISLPRSMPDMRWRTAAHLERAVAHIANLDPVPDAVFLTGDCVDGGTADEYKRLRAILDQLPVPYFLLMGNHDDREAMRSVFGDRDWFPDEGFVQYVVDFGELRLIALDTHVPGAPGGTLCDERLHWLNDRLSEVPDRPTILFLHHPPFSTAIQLADAMGLDAIEPLGSVVRRFDNVELLAAGHVHRLIQHRFFGTIALTCPSTSHQATLDLQPVDRLAFIDEPPGCLLHCWTSTTGLVSHVSYINDYGAEDLVYDGKRWYL
jgi:Icc protein